MLKPLQINVPSLVVFFFVATEGSLSSAADMLCVTQPAVTKHIRALEHQFGVRLIQVRKRKVHLTRTGQKLMEIAGEVYYSTMKAEAFLKMDRNANFRIGISSALTAYLAPIFDKFKEGNPSILLTIKEGASLQLVEELLDFEHDLCAVIPLFNVSEELQVFHIPEIEKMVLVTSPDNKLASKKRLAWEDLQGAPFLLHREGSIVRQLILDHFKRRNIEISPVANIDSINCMKRLVQEGQGVALMLHSSVRDEVAARRIKILPVIGGDFKMGTDIVFRRGMILSPACKAFLGLLETRFDQRIISLLEENS